MEEYSLYKRSFVENHDDFFGNITESKTWPYLLNQEQHPTEHFHVIQIMFDAPKFDRITRAAQTNLVAQISAIGGTLGLFSGFSILSGVEIIYFLCKAIVAMLENWKINKKNKAMK